MKNSSTNSNQSIPDKAEQLIRHYRIPERSEKKDVLNAILAKIENAEKPIESTKKPNINVRWISGISVAASVILFAAFYFYTATITINGLKEQTLTCRLPDNSRVVLQNQSEIQYKKYFWNRKVRLSGSAYFEVEKGTDFLVQTKLGNIEVLGTRFLVSEINDSLNVQCFEGKVRASISKEAYVLTPGTQMFGSKKEAVKTQIENEITYPAFARFKRTYSNEKLENVLLEMEDFFGIQIALNKSKTRLFSGKIETGNLEGSLDIVCTTMQLNYRFTNNTKVEIY